MMNDDLSKALPVEEVASSIPPRLRTRVSKVDKKNVSKSNTPGKLKNGAIFVGSELDDFGLKPPEFRLLAHIARRSEGFRCYSSTKDMASVTGMNIRSVRHCLKVLEAANIIRKYPPLKGHKSDAYAIQSCTKWVSKACLPEIRSRFPK